MAIFIAFLTLVMVLDCFLLILLVLIQLPKKEAGAGLAFGGGATDALFGAGSGNALTKLTKWSGGVFLGLCVLIGMLNVNRAHSGSSELRKALANQKPATPVPAPAPAKPANQFVPLPASSTNATITINTNAVAATNAAPVTLSTNVPTAAPKTNAAAPK
jgi:protein translocase SecG subunit